jgi:hypothetical protein
VNILKALIRACSHKTDLRIWKQILFHSRQNPQEYLHISRFFNKECGKICPKDVNHVLREHALYFMDLFILDCFLNNLNNIFGAKTEFLKKCSRRSGIAEDVVNADLDYLNRAVSAHNITYSRA